MTEPRRLPPLTQQRRCFRAISRFSSEAGNAVAGLIQDFFLIIQFLDHIPYRYQHHHHHHHHPSFNIMADSKDGKGDYAKVLEEGPSSKVVDGSSSSPPRSPMHQQQGGSLQTIANHPALPIFSYCAASILMTVTNKYVLSGLDFNLNFFLLCVQVGPFPVMITRSSSSLSFASVWFGSSSRSR